MNRDESLPRMESGSGKSGTKEAVVSSPEFWIGAGGPRSYFDSVIIAGP
jgi:hypothetical protein